MYWHKRINIKIKLRFQLLTLSLIFFLGLNNTIFAQISGTVFRDFNTNGVKDNSGTFNEVFAQGVTVTAYPTSGATQTATTNASGAYSFTGLTLPARIEFTGFLTGDYASANGTGSATSVQFYTAASTTANFGINLPEHYTLNPELIVPQYVNGNPVSSSASPGNQDALVRFSNAAFGTSPTLLHDANTFTIGSIYGLAYNRDKKRLFASAMLKRHTGLGSAGLGGIYIYDYSTATPSLVNTIDLDAAPFNINLGTIPNNATRGLGLAADPNYDVAAFSLVGKAGLGDIDLSADNNTLYATDLNNRNIIVLNMSTYNTSNTLPTTYTTIALPSVSCTNGVLRPWGLKYYRGKLYTGMVCSGESSSTTADVVMYVYAYDFATSTWAVQVTIPNYQRPRDWDNAAHYWKNWTDNIASMTVVSTAGGETRIEHAASIITDIEFDVDGAMLIGMADRIGYQIGNGNYGTNTSSSTLYSLFAHGDLLRASKSGAVYALESNGSVGGLTGCGVANASGPGGGEFYCGDSFGTNDHAETVVGGLALVAGTNAVATSSFDPLALDTGGIQWLNNTNGNETKAMQIYNADPWFFGKSNGLGDLEILSSPAPLEIGNRVFVDTDNDGVQDPSEAGIDGVLVELYLGATKVGSTTTATINGQVGTYFFTNANVNLGGATGIVINTAYEIRIPNVSGGSKQAALGANVLTTANQGANDLIDSDGTASSTNAIIALTTGSAGQNDHSYDFGFSTAACTTITSPSADQTICAGATGTNITVSTNTNAASSIKFVKFADTDQVSINASPTAPELATVYGGTAIATVTPTGGSSPYTATYTFATTDFPNTGTTVKYYYVYAILTNDVSGTCRPMQEIKITVNPLPSFSSVATDLTCYGANDGTLTINSVTGTAPFTYSKDDGATFQSNGGIYTGLLPTNYQPAIKDANGCVKKCTN